MNARLQASVAVEKRRSLFWNVARRGSVVLATFRESLQGESSPRQILPLLLDLEISVCCPETSVKNTN